MIQINKKRKVEPWTVEKLISLIESGELDFDTEYQREIIWVKSKKLLLVDSILQDIDIPKIYLAFFTKQKRYECIDGKQRIASIIDFYNNILQLESGKYFSKPVSISKKEQTDFSGYEFSVSIISDPSDEDISELFYRLNIGTPLNGGEQIHAMRGEMRDFVFKKVGENGPFIGKVGIKAFRFSREIAFSQMLINSILFRKDNDFVRARYEDIRKFLNEPDHKKFTKIVKAKTDQIHSVLKEIENIFGENINKLNRKSAVVSAYLFCEEAIVKKKIKDLKHFPSFYISLLDEMKNQAKLISEYKPPTNKAVLDFQKNLQQASAEGYSFSRRHEFLKKGFEHYLKTNKLPTTNY